MVATRPEVKMVTGKINGIEVTVPAGTNILDAARQVGIEVPNLCFQPKLRAWGSCRICTVEILGKRGGLIEGCATPLAEGMEVLTHSPEVEQARQFILQMYLIDHALDCPTCDASGQCYLQDNTYLHNINANPYRRPKLAQSYEHFSSHVDYKWDRCIMCARCTRVCDEMIGVIAIEGGNRSLEATITTAYGLDLSETHCTNCGMCIAVCPVGAMTDRHFGHHPWELDTTETICGHCDAGCTINIESNRGIVRRATHLWDRGVNHGYVCQAGKWGHEEIQHAERIFNPRMKDELGEWYEVTWDEAIDGVVETLAHYQGDRFAALASADSTNEEVYLLQQFTRAVMGTNNIDRHLTPAQIAVEQALSASLGRDVSHTNNLQEFFTDVKMVMVVGPDVNKASPLTSYWINHSALYREAKVVVISEDHSTLCDRAELWIKPYPGTTDLVLNAIAKIALDAGWADSSAQSVAGYAEWVRSLGALDVESAAARAGVSVEQLRRAAELYASGGQGVRNGAPAEGHPASLIVNTTTRQGMPTTIGGGYVATHHPGPIGGTSEPADRVATGCVNLAVLLGNIGTWGGGVLTPRGLANYQGATDLGARPHLLPGNVPVGDVAARGVFESLWASRWAEKARTRNGFVPVRSLPDAPGLSIAELPAAIERGDVKAMFIEGSLAGRYEALNPELIAALPKLEFLVVADAYDSPLTEVAHVVLPLAAYLEKDGTFTNFDRTVQRVRKTVPPMGTSKPTFEIVQMLANRFGYGMNYRHPSHVMAEIAQVVPAYRGVSYARLERGGLVVPMEDVGSEGTPILGAPEAHAVTYDTSLSLSFAGQA